MRAASRIAGCARSSNVVKEIELADAKLQESRRTLERRREEVSALKIRLQGVTERLSVLQDLQRRQEGISGGVRTILDQLRDSSSPLADNVHGIVAECFEVDVKVAPLIDAALGERSQYVIVSGGELQDAILDGALKINSRVGLIRIDELPKRRPGDRIRLDGLKGVIGRGDRMIKCEPKFEPLARHLLSNTWLVDSLQTALGLRKLSGAGLRFVTATGELLENDGSTVIGPTAASTGLVSRRSELAAAEARDRTLPIPTRAKPRPKPSDWVRGWTRKRRALGRMEQRHRGLIAERAAADAERRHTEERLRSHQVDLRRDRPPKSTRRLSCEIPPRPRTHNCSTKITTGRQEIERLEMEAAEVDEMLSETQTALQTATSGVMAISVDVARAEQKFEALSATMQQQRRDQGQREAAVEEVRVQASQGRGANRRVDRSRARCDQPTGSLQWDADQSSDRLQGTWRKHAADVRRENRDIMKASEEAMKQAAAASEVGACDHRPPRQRQTATRNAGRTIAGGLRNRSACQRAARGFASARKSRRRRERDHRICAPSCSAPATSTWRRSRNSKGCRNVTTNCTASTKT